MKEPINQKTIRRFLLGQLDDEGQQQIEERILTDGEFKQEVLMVEDELLEDYVTDTLPEYERELIRNHYLSTPRQWRKLKLGQALTKYAKHHPVQPVARASETSRIRSLLNIFGARNRFLQFSWIAALLLVIIGVSWIFFQVWLPRWQQSTLNEELARLNSPQSIETTPDSSVGVVTLRPIQLRNQGGDLNRLVITPAVTMARLRLPLMSNKYETYQVTLAVEGGSQVFTLGGLRPRTEGQSTLLVLQAPARLLTANDYLISVNGLNSAGRLEAVGDYFFRVVIQP